MSDLIQKPGIASALSKVFRVFFPVQGVLTVGDKPDHASQVGTTGNGTARILSASYPEALLLVNHCDNPPVLLATVAAMLKVRLRGREEDKESVERRIRWFDSYIQALEEERTNFKSGASLDTMASLIEIDPAIEVAFDDMGFDRVVRIHTNKSFPKLLLKSYAEFELKTGIRIECVQ